MADERELLEEAGFSRRQIEALMDAFTVHHHTHSMDEVEGLEEELLDITDDDDDEE